MFQSLPGFREFLPDACRLREHLFRVWRENAQRHGFEEFDGPALEPLELYVEKSGPEIVSQLFAFEDRGGRQVALRPEMTPTLARLYGERAQSLPKPVRWFSIGEQYRFERPQKGRLRAFYQLNVDLLGIEGPAADLEVIACAANTLRAFGLGPQDFQIRLSDRRLWLLFLAGEDLPPETIGTVLALVDKLERTPREKTLEGLSAIVGKRAPSLLAAIEDLRAIRDRSALEAFLLDRNPKHPEAVTERLADWDRLLEGLTAYGLGEYSTIDCGIVRGLAYYTGFVFELFEATGEGRALAGGGRYDDLVAKLGGPATPAVGMGMGDVTLIDLLTDRGLLPRYIDSVDCFVVADPAPETSRLRLQLLGKLRAAGCSAVGSVKDNSFGKQFKEASHKGARTVLVLGPEEAAAGTVKVKNSASREEITVTIAEAIPAVLAILGGRSDEG